MKVPNILQTLFYNNKVENIKPASVQPQIFQFQSNDQDLMRGLIIEHRKDDVQPSQSRPKQLSSPQDWTWDNPTQVYTKDYIDEHRFEIRAAEGKPLSSDLNFNTEDGIYMLKHLSFDNKTFQNTSEENLPQGWNPQQIIEEGRSIGQNIDKTHEMGYTGKGITVAVVDSPIIMHQDIESSLASYEIMDNADKYKQPADMHGQATSDILVGDKDGVAPDSNLVYFAATGGVYGEPMINDRLQALQRIVEINKNAKPEDKIKVVSLSWGINEGEEGYDEYLKILQTLVNDGVFVVTADMNMSNGSIYGMNMPYKTLHKKDQTDDQNNFSNYVVSLSPGEADESLCILAGDRTVASAISPNKYRHDSQDSTSWTVPALAGIYTCALQCAKENDVELTPQKFWQWALETGVPVNYENGENGEKAIDTEALCKYIENQGQNK